MKIALGLFIALIPTLGFSQYELYNTGSDIYIQKGALVHVQGTVTNANDAGGSNGAFTNEGILELDGDFNNVAGATFQYDNSNSSTDRAVKFTGASVQSIGGSLSSSSASFYNLVLDQGLSSNSVKMQTNVAVKGSLVFNSATIFGTAAVTTTAYNPSVTGSNNGLSGFLQTYDNIGGTEYTLDIQNGNADAIAGYPAMVIGAAPSTAYILTKGTAGSSTGGIQRKIGSAASYIFPFGTLSHGFNAVQLNFHTVPGSGNDRVMGKFCNVENTQNGRYIGSISQYCNGCNWQFPPFGGYNRYFPDDPCNSDRSQWIILQDQAISHGYWSFTSPNNSTQYKYDMQVYPNGFVTNDGLPQANETWRVLKYDDVNDTYGYDPSQDNWQTQIEQVSNINDLLTYSLNTGCYNGTGIPGGIYSGFSEFSIGKSNSENALPVTITTMEAHPVNNQYIEVNWVTSLEINNRGFHVQRSTDGLNFTDIGWVNGHGNSTQTIAYFFDDKEVQTEVVYYYRLIQVDNNGIQTPTGLVQAMLHTTDILLVSDPVPNPSSDRSAIIITTSLSKDINVKLYDVLGQQLSDKNYNLSAGENTVTFNTSVLASGNYTAIITVAENLFSKRLVVTK